MTHKAAIIGLGIMGRRMLAAMRVHERFTVVALFDPSAAAVAEVRAAWSEAPVVDSAEAAIGAADIVYLACPPAPRKALALAAAAAGKAVFLEKPLGVDVAECRDLVARLAAVRVPRAVNFTQAGGRPIAEVARALAAGEMGRAQGIDIVVTYAAWPREWQVAADWLRFAAEGGYTREVISHFLFLSARLLGPLSLVWARANYPADPALCESHVLARLETAEGLPVSLLGAVGGAQPDRQEVTVKGRARSYRFDNFHGLLLSDGGPFAETMAPVETLRGESLASQLAGLDACLGSRDHPLATPEEALAVQELVEAILAARGEATRGRSG